MYIYVLTKIPMTFKMKLALFSDSDIVVCGWVLRQGVYISHLPKGPCFGKGTNCELQDHHISSTIELYKWLVQDVL